MPTVLRHAGSRRMVSMITIRRGRPTVPWLHLFVTTTSISSTRTVRMSRVSLGITIRGILRGPVDTRHHHAFDRGRSAMKKNPSFVFIALVGLFSWAAGQELAPISLPPPQTEIGRPLMQALKVRQSSRSFSSKPLPPQELSNLLWAAD